LRAFRNAAASYWEEQRRAVQEAARGREFRKAWGTPPNWGTGERAERSPLEDPSRYAFGTLVIASVLRVFGVLAAALGLGTAIAEWATARDCFRGSCYLNRSAIVAGFVLLFGGTLYAALLWGLASALSVLQLCAWPRGRAPGPRP
jgi:hypothetical protein